MKENYQKTMDSLQVIVTELEKVYGEPWLIKMCKQLYGLLPGGTKAGKIRRRLSEPPPTGEKFSGLHLDVSEVKKVLESHYSNLNQTNGEEGSSGKPHLHMISNSEMPSLDYSILRKDPEASSSQSQKQDVSCCSLHVFHPTFVP